MKQTSTKKYLSYYINRVGMQRHQYHLVTRSPWPILASIGALILTFNTAAWFHGYITAYLVVLAFIFLCFISVLWWRDVIRESTLLGYHTMVVVRGIRMGIVLFIVSEVMFFFAFFWTFFHSALAPSIVVGSIWPPIGIKLLDVFQIPLLNTFILLISGITVTLTHHCVQWDNIKNQLVDENGNDNYLDKIVFILSVVSLITTIILAIEFTCWQLFEYTEAWYYINDGIYGSCFYLTTGFHGFHVLIGTIFLSVGLYRLICFHLLPTHHVGLEGAIWYWHFVDVVWLFLYVFVYCWSGL